MRWIALGIVSVVLIAALIALCLVCNTNGEIRKSRECIERDRNATEKKLNSVNAMLGYAITVIAQLQQEGHSYLAERDAAQAEIDRIKADSKTSIDYYSGQLEQAKKDAAETRQSLERELAQTKLLLTPKPAKTPAKKCPTKRK